MVGGMKRKPRQVTMDLGYRDGAFLAALRALGRRGSPGPEPARDAAVLDLRGRLLEESTPTSPLPGVSRRLRETLGTAEPALPQPWTGRSGSASRGCRSAPKPLPIGSIASKGTLRSP